MPHCWPSVATPVLSVFPTPLSYSVGHASLLIQCGHPCLVSVSNTSVLQCIYIWLCQTVDPVWLPLSCQCACQQSSCLNLHSHYLAQPPHVSWQWLLQTAVRVDSACTSLEPWPSCPSGAWQTQKARHQPVMHLQWFICTRLYNSLLPLLPSWIFMAA